MPQMQQQLALSLQQPKLSQQQQQQQQQKVLVLHQTQKSHWILLHSMPPPVLNHPRLGKQKAALLAVTHLIRQHLRLAAAAATQQHRMPAHLLGLQMLKPATAIQQKRRRARAHPQQKSLRLSNQMMQRCPLRAVRQQQEQAATLRQRFWNLQLPKRQQRHYRSNVRLHAQ
jgi:hypothetical protein